MLTIRSAVRVLPIPDRAHFDDSRLVVEVVDDAVIADAHAPEVGGTTQLLAARRARCHLQRVQLSRDPSQHRIRQRVELLPRCAHEAELVH